MSASAATVSGRRPQPAAARAEHISIEGEADSFDTPLKQPHRITRHRYVLRSTLRGCCTELAILEGGYLGVQMTRPDRETLKYQFDLRFTEPKPVLVRHVSWTWLVVSVGLILLGAGALFSTISAQAPLLSVGMVGGAIAVLAGVGAALLFLRRTTESLEFHSAHGGATLVSVTGGIGSTRGGKKFFIELMKTIAGAKRERPQGKPQFLRDEMREHHRLHALGVLSEEEYASSKARILAAH